MWDELNLRFRLQPPCKQGSWSCILCNDPHVPCALVSCINWYTFSFPYVGTQFYRQTSALSHSPSVYLQIGAQMLFCTFCLIITQRLRLSPLHWEEGQTTHLWLWISTASCGLLTLSLLQSSELFAKSPKYPRALDQAHIVPSFWNAFPLPLLFSSPLTPQSVL